MPRFESGTALAAVPPAFSGDAAAIARIAGCEPVARALAAVSASRAAALAIEVADLRDAVLGSPLDAIAGRLPGRYDVSTGGDAGAVMASAVLALRRAQLDAYGVRREMPGLGAGDRALAGVMLDADAAAFLVHVAAEAAAAGMTALARHVEGSNSLAGVADAYRRGVRKGGPRVGAAMAFAAAAGDEGFVARRLEGLRAEPEPLGRGVALRLSGSSPAGGAYPDRAFLQAVDRLRDVVAARIEEACEADGGLRAAA